MDTIIGLNYLAPLNMPATISLIGGPAGAVVEQSITMTQNPGTGDLYSVVTLTDGDRHLIRYNKADVDAFNPLTDLSIDAQYVGPTCVDIADGDFVEVDDPEPLPADGNGDGTVDGLDYLRWAGFFGTHPGPDGDISDGDYNDDGWVDGPDYLLWAGNFGAQESTAVPEPASGMLLLWGLVACLGRRRRSR